MRSVLAVAMAMLRGWRREVIRALGGNVWAYRCVCLALGLAAVGWMFVAASAERLVDGNALIENGLSNLLLSMTLNLSLTTAAMGIVGLALLVPDESAFATLIATAPMRAMHRRLALDAPALILTFMLAIVMSAPFVWISVAAAPQPAQAVVLPLAWLAVTVATMLLSISGFRIAVHLIARALRVHRPLAQASAALLMFAVIGHQCVAGAMNAGSPSATRRLLQSLTNSLQSSPFDALFIVAGLFIVAVALWWATASVFGRYPLVDRSRITGPRSGRIGDRPRSLLVLEFVQLARYPGTLSFVAVLAGFTAAVVVSEGIREALLWPLGGVLILSMTCLLALSNYGATWLHHWIYRVHSVAPGRWIRSKWLANALLLGVVLLSVNAGLLFAPGWEIGLFLGVCLQIIAGFVVTMFIGLVVPVSDEQPLSSVVAVVLAASAGLVVSVLFSRLDSNALAAVGATLAIAAAGVFAYHRTACWRERDLVF